MQEDAELKLLIEPAKHGDVDAFGRLVATLRPGVARVIARYAFAEQDREDLLQDVFIRVYRSLKNYSGRGSFNGWVLKIAVNTSIDWLRKKMRRREIPESQLTTDERNLIQDRLADNDDNSPYDETRRKMDIGILYKALDQLNPDDRTAIVLFELEGMSIEEIASATGWSKSKVKVRCHRARGKLAQWLKDKGEMI